MPQEQGNSLDADDLENIHAVAREAVADHARRCEIPGCEGDLAQEALLRFLQDRGKHDTQPADVRIYVRKAAYREQWRRRNHGMLLTQHTLSTDAVVRHTRVVWDPVLAPARGVPRLCPDLASFGRGTPAERRLAMAIREAASIIARQPKVLEKGQFRIFAFAYLEGFDAREIAAFLRTTPGAATKRIGRVANRIENELAAAVARSIEVEAGHPNVKSSISLTPSAATLCATVLCGLEGVIHRNPGTSRPMG